MGWTTPWAPTPAELAACVECGLCLPHCPTFRLTGDEAASPRGRLKAMSAVARGDIALDAAVADVFEFCLQCRGCEAACPSLVPFGRAMEGARAEVTAALPRSRTSRAIATRWVVNRRSIGLVTRMASLGQRLGAGRWLPGRAGRSLRGLRRVPWRRRSVVGSTVGEGSLGTVGMLAGCVMDPWFAGVHQAVRAVLVAAGYRVVSPEGQTCCGALAAHEGRAADAAAMVERNAAAFAGVDLLVVDAAGCSAHLAHAPVGVPVEDALVTVARLIGEGRLPTIPGSTPVAIQDACHHRHAQRIVDAPRAILRAAGHDPVEIDPDGLCCGAAGLWSLGHPAESAELGRRKAAQVTATGATRVASSNPGCEMQLRAHLPRGVEVAHPIEIYAEAVGITRV